MNLHVINGPNLNMLGKRDVGQYGNVTLPEIERKIREKSKSLAVSVEMFQSNYEGGIVEHIQGLGNEVAGIVINPGALTHYGISMRDALQDSRLPVVEVHLSNIHSREDFRHHSVLAPIILGQVVGLGWRGYLYALEYLSEYLQETEAV